MRYLRQRQEISLKNGFILTLIVVTPVEIRAQLARFPISVTQHFLKINDSHSCSMI